MTTADDYEVRCKEWSDIVDHLPRLHTEASIDGVKVVELGVRSGNSTAAFLAAAETHGGHVWSVDTVWPNVPREWNQGPWTFILGDDLEVDDELPDEVDIVFIDTMHTFTQTAAELVAYAPKVRSGGAIICHDTELERPEASPPTDPRFPVAAAIRAWAATRDDVAIEWVSGNYGLAVIRIGGTNGDLDHRR